MNKQKLQESLAEAKRVAQNTEGLIAKLETQLAEKPELRHGDYGRDQYNRINLIINDGLDAKTYLATGESYSIGSYQNGTYNKDGGSRDGNIFDDLKARQEPLEEFRMCGILVKFSTLGNIQLASSENNTLYIGSDKWHAFILNLQRLVYTAEAK